MARAARRRCGPGGGDAGRPAARVGRAAARRLALHARARPGRGRRHRAGPAVGVPDRDLRASGRRRLGPGRSHHWRRHAVRSLSQPAGNLWLRAARRPSDVQGRHSDRPRRWLLAPGRRAARGGRGAVRGDHRHRPPASRGLAHGRADPARPRRAPESARRRRGSGRGRDARVGGRWADSGPAPGCPASAPGGKRRRVPQPRADRRRPARRARHLRGRHLPGDRERSRRSGIAIGGRPGAALPRPGSNRIRLGVRRRARGVGRPAVRAAHDPGLGPRRGSPRARV